MPDNVSTAKFTVDISDLKKNIQEANRQIKLTNAEFKAASAGMGNWAKSADGLSAKVKQLQNNLKNQKTILNEYKKQLELIEKQYGKDSKEADEMRVKIYNQEAVVKNTEAALGKYEKELVNVEKETKKASSAYEELDKKIKEQEKVLEETKKEYASVVLEQGKNSKAAKELAKEIDGLSKELETDKKAFDDAGKAADKLAGDFDETSKNAISAGDAAKKAGDGFTIMKGILADLAATAIKACVDGLKDLAGAAVDAWKAFDEGRDTVIKLTGATGEAADRLMQSYGNVSKVVLADSSEIGKAIGEVNTRWGVSGDRLTNLSTKYLKFSKITESDVIGSIDDTQKALAAYGKGIESVDSFLDVLAATSQATGVGTGTLTSGIISNATAFQEMGLTLEQSVGLMGQLEKSGVNSETVLNGMRKALKNSAKDGKGMSQALLDLQKKIESNKNGTKGLQAAYDMFGKSGDQIYGAIKNGTLSFRDMSKAMTDTRGTVDKTYDGMLDATDKLKLKFQEMKFTLATTFDSFLQENSPMLEEAIDQVGDAIISVMPSISSALTEILPYITDFIKNDLPVLVENLKNELPGIIENIIKKIPDLIELIEKAIPKVMELVDYIMEHKDEIIAAIEAIVAVLTTGKIISAITTIVEAVKSLGIAFEGASGAAATLGTVFSTVFAGILSFLAGAEIGKKLGAWLFPEDADIYEHYSGIKGTFEMLRDLIVTIGEEIYYKWQDIVAFFKDAWANIKQFGHDAFEGLKSLWIGAAEWFDSTVVEPIVGFFSGLWENVTTFAQSAWDGICKIFGDAAGWFTKVFNGVSEAIGKIMNGIVGIVKKPINSIIQMLNKFIDGINTIQIPDWVPAVGGKGINIPHIRELEQGGVLKKGQTGFLEGNGAEAVVPLDKNKAWISAVTLDLKRSLASEGLVGANGQISTRKSGDTIYNFNQTNNSPKALSRLEIYRQTRNQLAMVNGGV